MEEGFEVIVVPQCESITEEVIKDVMGSQWDHLSKYQIVVILSFQLVGKDPVGFIDSDKFSVGSLIIGIGFGVVFQGKFPIGRFDIIKSSCFRDTQGVVIAVQRIRVVLVEELLLFLIDG
jgi:hypothetical protein